MKRKGRKNSSPFIFLIGVTLLITGTFVYVSHTRSLLSFAEEPEVVSSPQVYRPPQPIEIRLPTLKLALPLAETEIKNDVWQIPNKGAAHLAISSRPGEDGNIVVYGHNKAAIFGRLSRLVPGDQITLVGETGKEHDYMVRFKTVIAPTEMQYVQPTDSEVLTIYTCTGIFDTKRLLIQALPVN